MNICRKDQKLILKLTALTVLGLALASTEAWSASSMRAAKSQNTKLAKQSTKTQSKKAISKTYKSKTVMASANPTQSLQMTAPAPAAPKKAFSGSVNVSPARTLVDFQDGSKNESLDLTFENAYQINDLYKLKSKFIYSNDLKNSSRSDFADGEVSLNRSAIELGSTFNMAPILLGSIPLSKTSRLDNKYYGGLGVSFKWGFISGVLPKGLSISLATAFSRLFYEASTSLSGKVLNQYTAYQKLVVNYSVDKHSFTFVGNHVNALTFQNSLKESFVLAEEYEYSAADNISVILGHANAGAALKANGQDSNIQLVNENTSVVYAGVTFKY